MLPHHTFSGVDFILNGETIPTNGSGHVLLTDIGSRDETALICQSDSTISDLGDGDWYLDPEQERITSTDSDERIDGDNDRGWTRNRATTIAGHRIVRLRRVSDTATEGRFTCEITGDGNEAVRGLLVLHPSESLLNVRRFWCTVYVLLLYSQRIT